MKGTLASLQKVGGALMLPIAVLPLAPAADNDAVTELPPVSVPGARGAHDLCFRFAQRTLDPTWAIDWVQLSP